MSITQAELKSLLHYNPLTGEFHKFCKNKSKITGYINVLGYSEIRVKSKLYLAHRLAWLYVYGLSPNNEIDHRDHNRSNNKIKNLRDATRVKNSQNASLQKGTVSGVLGVAWCKQREKWIAQIKINYKTINLGGFKLKADAIKARKEANTKYGFHANHGVTL